MKISIYSYRSIRKKFTNFLVIFVFVMLFLFLPNYSLAAPSTDKMLGYWKFDDNMNDSSGDGNTGFLYNGANYIASYPMTSFPNTKGVYFPSLSSYIEVPNQAGVSPIEAITFSMWVRLDMIPANNQVVGGNYVSYTSPEGFKFNINTAEVSFNIGNTSASFPIGGNIFAGSWFHLAGTWDGTTIKIYLNGQEKNTATYTIPITYSSTAFKLGNFMGKMDETRLYNRVLTQPEILDLAAGKHTSMTWDGSTSVDYEDSTNWDLEVVPDPYTLITIPEVNNNPEFTQAEGVAGIKILTNSSLDIHARNLTINDSGVGVFSNDGSLILENVDNQNIYGFINDINSGTVVINQLASTTSLKTGVQYFNLTKNGLGSLSSQPAALIVKGNLVCAEGIFVLQANMTVHGNISLNGGSLSASSTTPISLYGNWYSLSGTSFNAGGGTVNLLGTMQSIIGFNNFHNLTKNASVASTLIFDANLAATQNIQGVLSLNGSAGNLLRLRSSVDGTHCKINPQGSVSISYLDVKDSENLNAEPINASSGNIFNSGGNVNWIFDSNAPVITLNVVGSKTSNPLYQVKGTAVDANTVSAVFFRIDGAAWLQCTPNDGTFDSLYEAFTCTPGASLNDGAHIIELKASDFNANATAIVNYSIANFTVDTVLPIISSTVATPGDNSAIINWLTDEASSSIVDYGITSAYGQSTIEQDLGTPVQSHSVSILGLSSCTNYHFRVRSNDSVANQIIGSDQTFSTGGCVAAAQSSTNSETCGKDKPGEPDITSVEADGSTSITLEIDEASGTVDEYEIKYGKSDDNFEWSVDDIDEDDIDSFIIDELSPGTTYYFKVRAINECEDGDWSDEMSAKTDNESIASVASSTANIATNTLVPDEIPVVNNKVEPMVENIVNAKESSEEEIVPPDNDNEQGGKVEDADDFESAKESDAPDTKDYGATSVEMLDYVAGVKKIKISGYGPPNSLLTVYVYSDNPIVLSVKTDSDGNWSYILDSDLEDGEHQVYVAVTEDTGKIKSKSNPLVFVKTAQAVTKVSGQSSSPTEIAKGSFMIYAVAISAITVLLALLIIGWRFRSQKAEEKMSGGF